MAKNDVSKGIGTDSDSEPATTSVSKSAPSKDVELVFKQNRTHELHIGRSVFVFGPMGRQRVPIDVIEHPDFATQSQYFIINK